VFAKRALKIKLGFWGEFLTKNHAGAYKAPAKNQPYPLSIQPYYLYTVYMIDFDPKVQDAEIADLQKEEEESLMKMLSDKYGLPYIDLRGLAPDPDALRFIKEEEGRKAGIVPFKLVGHKLYVATVGPNNPLVQELLAPLETRGTELVMYLCSHASLEHVFARYADLTDGTKVNTGLLDLSLAKMEALAKTFSRPEDMKLLFDELVTSNILYKTTRIIELIIAGALKFDASDIHIEPEENTVRVRYRLNGVLEDIAHIDAASLKQINSRFKLMSGLKLSNTTNAQDGRFSIDLGEVEIDVRVSVIPGNYGESFVMRLLDPRHTVADISGLALGPTLRDALEHALTKPNGVVLTTGPTGSGKTTTLYAFLRQSYSPDVKIITIEDPIEYHLEGITQTQVDEKKDYTFLSGLRAALRQDPDVIMVGEIRDEDTAKVAVNAALTGHIVFSTLHTNNAAATIPRLIDLKVNPKIIASALSLALAQRLVRVLCNDCKKEDISTEKEARIITNALGVMKTNGMEDEMLGFTPSVAYQIFRPVGCEQCNNGYKGRVGIFEAIVMNQQIETVLNGGNPSERDVRDAGKSAKIPTLLQDGILKVLQGVTSLDEVGKAVDLLGE
jgi:type IV pilus assembly protein PilB